jgi:peptidyl-prolyl cis-trans isomerase D
VKAIAEDVDAYRTDKTVIATARSGNLDAGRMSKWMAAFPPQSRMRANVVQAPDSLIPMFVQNVMRNELLLRAADEAKVDLDSAQMAELRTAFYGGVMNAMSRLNIAPSQLADSGADLAARQRLAASRIEEYMGGMVTNQREYVDVAEQIVLVLRDKYESRIVPAGIDRVLAEATKVRAAADSARAANQPQSAVPMMTPPPAAAPTTPQQP